jgi:tetratricopeptide (TPR) repeat protein
MLVKNRCCIKAIFLMIAIITMTGIVTGCKAPNSNEYIVYAKNKRDNPKGYNYADVLNDYNEAIKLDPNNIEAYNGRGDLLSRPRVSPMFDNDYDISRGTNFDIQNQDLAIDDFNKAIEIKPNAASYIKRAYSKIAENVNHRRKRDELSDLISNACQGVDEDISKAIAIDPNYSDAYYLKAHCYEDSHHYSKSKYTNTDNLLQDYNKAIELNPNNIHAYYGRALLKKYSFEDESGAIADISKAIEIDGSNPYSFKERAYFKNLANDKRGAIEDYEQAIKLYQDRGSDYAIDSIRSDIRRIKSNL